MFSVTPVDRARADELESLGAKPKFWYRDKDKRRWLFKVKETGEDWAEKITCELAECLGLPHVHYELASESSEKKRGVICENCAPSPSALILGNQLMWDQNSTYPRGNTRKYKVREHTVDAVAQVVETLDMLPSRWTQRLPKGICSALDVFVGYIMLDAWVANQDRHHENWGAIKEGNRIYLAPTFDHGAALARNLKDEERHERMMTRDPKGQICAFVRRARSAFYKDSKDTKTMTTIDAWWAFSEKCDQASIIWREQLEAIDENRMLEVLKKIPSDRLSSDGQNFTHRLLIENRIRILKGEKQ